MLLDHLQAFNLSNYEIQTCVVNSTALKANPLNDPYKRHNPVLVPKSKKTSYPVILVLSGYSGDGFKNFSFRGFENNLVQDIDMWTEESLIPEAIYVFVNAWTAWGGSQFVNSQGCGHYEDYISQDLYEALKADLPVSSDPKMWSLFGGSSGGYGALNLGSKYPDKFQNILALAPDSFFEASLLPELYKALPYIKELKGCKNILEQQKSGDLKLKGSNFFLVFNAVAMSYCYAGINKLGEPIFPIDSLGILQSEIWQRWKQNDPLIFLKERTSNLKSLNSIYLSVGHKDEFCLQYGARQISNILEQGQLKHTYKEFKGTHRDLSKDRKAALSWLKNKLS